MNKASCKQLLTEFVLPVVFISLFFGVAAAWPFDWFTEPTAATKTAPETKQDVKRPTGAKEDRALAGGAPTIGAGLSEPGAITR
ncbi:MAG: hypothetical protein P9C36_13185 [Defluviicoccus sp.]|nr:hypothetical protein [Defluviicoccus sp.]MDG4593569.1 hypothetical protein [Defluviicoccus sp.]MDS4011449.1 hypothetical protein [Defluviicoccus sp.]MDS4073744.1 hypothetical protein [Defluviicoccus sp.]